MDLHPTRFDLFSKKYFPTVLGYFGPGQEQIYILLYTSRYDS